MFKFLTVHASATPANRDIGVQEIDIMHRKRKFNGIGYHYVIRRDGRLEKGRALNRQGAHVAGHNPDNLGVCLVGGVDKHLNPENNFTKEQMITLEKFIRDNKKRYGIKLENIKGHRDWSPDLNKDGKITSNEFIKACPCFDVKSKLKEWGI
ncbi:TPA: N-acetylmuramoyl-L-alanine amidase [Photobacterium damselae]